MIWILASFQLGHDVYLWPPNRASLFILQLLFLLLFPRLFSVVADWMSARGFLKVQDTKIRHLHTIAKLCWAISSQLRRTLTIGKKLVKQLYLLDMSSQYGELWPTNSWYRLVSLGYPSKFQRVSRLGFLAAATSLNRGQPNFVRCLAMSWAGTLYTGWPIKNIPNFA